MTCKDDCLYYTVCSDFRGNICENDLNRFMEYRMNSDGLCDNFKNKAGFEEVKHGGWIREHINGSEEVCRCTVCDEALSFFGFYKAKHCSNCGAKMDGGNAE